MLQFVIDKIIISLQHYNIKVIYLPVNILVNITIYILNKCFCLPQYMFILSQCMVIFTYYTYSFFRDNILGASPGLEDIGNGRGHAMIRSMLMTVSGETLRKILELFREQPEFKDRVKLVMEAYELFWSS